ncbi:Ras-like protein gene family, member A [Nematocida major]|uniref:Ras-like protein gene family, member A n=1 Tax=Nematocida major TaxID=1912982 RepID=UPI002008E8C8|nr:Ras-like protein gene family, member A [Nematocida major]KAH9386002.1 Ras-like protein gene family, member A [Nematocida major]
MEEREKSKKIIVVGDGGCGKTCLLIKYTENRFEKEHTVTVFENKTVPYLDKLTGQTYFLDLWDTAGQDDFDRIRKLCYIDTNLILICFSLDKPESFKNIEGRWREEVDHFCKETPRILVGLKADLRTTSSEKLISETRARQLAHSVSAKCYIECSAATGENVSVVFDTAINILLNRTRKKKDKGPTCKTF